MEAGEMMAASKAFWHAFPNPACFPPRIPNKALAVLRDFKELQGPSDRSIFRRRDGNEFPNPGHHRADRGDRQTP
jgi:hypothetical protein